MKRLVRSNKDLSYVVDGEVRYLPTWCIDWSDDEILRAKRIAIDAEKSRSANKHNAKWVEDPRYTDDEIPELRRELKEAGFNNREIDIIINDVQSGRTLDSAMQQFGV